MKRTILTAATVLLAALLPVLGALLPARAGAAQAGGGHGLVVPTDRGLVQGKSAEGADQWLGIPYAAPASRRAGGRCAGGRCAR